MAQPSNRQELRDWILRKLGYPCNTVELTPEQLDDSIEDAIGKFNQYMCKPVPSLLTEQTGDVLISLADADRGVVDVQILRPEVFREFAQLNIFEILYRMVFPRLNMGDWYMLRTYYEMFQRVRGTDPDWYYDENSRTLFVDCISGPYAIFYVTAQDLSVEDIFQRMKQGYKKDFRDYSLAEAKIVLARVRGKFGGSIPVPGGQMTTDAEILKQEGDTKKLEIEARLEQIARFSTPPVMWG